MKTGHAIYVDCVIQLHGGGTETITKSFSDWFSARHYAAGLMVGGCAVAVAVEMRERKRKIARLTTPHQSME